MVTVNEFGRRSVRIVCANDISVGRSQSVKGEVSQSKGDEIGDGDKSGEVRRRKAIVKDEKDDKSRRSLCPTK